ncbi:MAG: hypothetical protein V3U84_11495 [Thiotrichaceae bacterium]
MALWSQMNVDGQWFDTNGDPLSGGVLKAYDPGGLISTSIAITSSGGSPQASITLNANGQLAVGGVPVLPFIDRVHKWGVFANATDAAADTPFFDGPFDNVPQNLTTSQPTDLNTAKSYTDLDAKTSANYTDGDFIEVTNNGIKGTWVVRSGAHTPYAGVVRTFDDDPNKYIERDFQGPASSDWWEILKDGSDQFTEIVAFHDYLLAEGKNGHFPGGTFDCGINNWPFKNAVITSLKDYGGMIITGEGKGKTIFRTTSALGADVLNLNALKNISFRELSVTAVLTGSSGAGSNGVSITNGGENIDLDVDAFDCPGLDQGGFIDGGKAWTIQNGAATLPFKNIKIRGRANDCPFGYNQDAAYADFDATQDPSYSGIDIDVVAQDCWRATTFGGASAVGALAENDRDCGISVKCTAIDCAQPLVMTRWVRTPVDIHIINRKAISALFKPFAADQTVYGASITGGYRSDIKVTGRMLEADYKIQLGGTTQGGGVSGACVGMDIDFELECPTVNTSDLNLINSGGNSINNSTVKFSSSFAALASPSDFLTIANNNSVTIGGKLTGSFTGTLTGLTTSPTGTVEWSLSRDEVTIEFPQILATSNSTFMTMTGIPTDIIPTSAQLITIVGQDNAVDIFAKAGIETDGTITFYAGPTVTAGSWTATGSKGIQPITATYRRS